jgi:hypothetical protein
MMKPQAAASDSSPPVERLPAPLPEPLEGPRPALPYSIAVQKTPGAALLEGELQGYSLKLPVVDMAAPTHEQVFSQRHHALPTQLGRSQRLLHRPMLTQDLLKAVEEVGFLCVVNHGTHARRMAENVEGMFQSFSTQEVEMGDAALGSGSLTGLEHGSTRGGYETVAGRYEVPEGGRTDPGC